MRPTHFAAPVFTLLLLALVNPGCNNNSSSNPYPTSPTAPAPVQTSPNTVLMSGMTFSPASITVPVGTTITWKNNDGVPHTSTSDTGVWNTGNIDAGKSAVTTFDAAGTYPYTCTYHASMGMKGTVIVQ